MSNAREQSPGSDRAEGFHRTGRPHQDERDPQPAPDWQPTSHAWARRQALEAAAAAVTAAKEARKKPVEEGL